MIHYTQGNLLEAPAEALVNTVNEIGVMGKGIALMFRETFPDNARAYEDACKAGDVHVGHVLATRNPALLGPRDGLSTSRPRNTGVTLQNWSGYATGSRI